MTKALSTQEFVAKATRLHGGKYSYENTVYVRSQRKVVITCPQHGDFSARPNSHISASQLNGCPRCGGTGAFTYKAFLAVAHAAHGSYEYDASSYVNTNTHVRIHCAEHGWFLQTPTRHMAGRGCQKCGGTARVSSTEILQRCTAVHGGKYAYHLVASDARLSDVVEIVCPKHGMFLQSLKLHSSRGNGCGRCSGRVSTGERELSAYISSLGVTVKHNARKVLPGFEIDIYAPEQRIGVEYNGGYWHTDTKVGAHYHRGKWDAAQEGGLRLIQVFDDEWLTQQDIVKARLAALFGVAKVLDARKCQVAAVSAEEGRIFLQATHSQGSGRASCYYGLSLAGVLVAVASFGPARSGGMTGAKQEGVWEVMRYASTGRVRGGFSRLLAQFKRDYAPQALISYCDLRYGDGRLYAASGFTLDSITPPDYWWLPYGRGVKRVARYVTQKHKLESHPVLGKFFAPEKSESQICAEAGWEKIHGVGHQKWVWQLAPQTTT